ncbi:hypothetical protein D3C84_94450 [compost metagenome]
MSQAAAEYFNEYLLKAVEIVHRNWACKGYASAAYTHGMTLGDIKFNPSKPPYTMCVAAQMELIVTALGFYMDDTGDKTAATFLPSKQWTSLSPGTFKDLIWVNSGSRGTADALERFGMGVIRPFKDLIPGCFINLNRTNKSGHAVLFLGFLDRHGETLDSYSSEVAGFKYYSSQGKLVGGGFDYRYAFFDDTCPTLESSRRRDCGVIRSEKQNHLNTGYMFSPTKWDAKKRDQALSALHNLSQKENEANPLYLNQDTTDD